MQHYLKLELVGFGKQLFNSYDLDPIYTSIIALRLEREQLYRWLVAYWLFYHSGFASMASEREGKDFWLALGKAARNRSRAPGGGRWPRGSERRHFRGDAAVKVVKTLYRRYGKHPEDMVRFIADGPMNVQSVIDRATQHPLFGPWIGFKVADMLDAVAGLPVEQDDVSVFLYKTPRESILENLKHLPIRKGGSEPVMLERAMVWLQKELKAHRIPHKPKQTPDWFSIETVWCKHLSHMHGHYPLYKDIVEIRHGLEHWVEASPTAQRFLRRMPAVPLNGSFF